MLLRGLGTSSAEKELVERSSCGTKQPQLSDDIPGKTCLANLDNWTMNELKMAIFQP